MITHVKNRLLNHRQVRLAGAVPAASHTQNRTSRGTGSARRVEQGMLDPLSRERAVTMPAQAGNRGDEATPPPARQPKQAGSQTSATTKRPARPIRRATGVAVGLLAAWVGLNVWNAAHNALTFPQFWQEQTGAAMPPEAIRLVAFGDSETQAIGAAHPMEGFVGRIASYAQQKTGRPVHIANMSGGGATYGDLAQQQIPRVDLPRADIVIVATSSDLEAGVPLATFRQNLDTVLGMLPGDKTIVSDLPFLPGREAYQTVLQERADAHQVARADFAAIFNHEGRRLDIFSWLPPHLNSTGYAFWFLAFRPGVDKIIAELPSRQ